jgi:uncharacterized surface protein with fasciclin (FAS1) repeats
LNRCIFLPFQAHGTHATRLKTGDILMTRKLLLALGTVAALGTPALAGTMKKDIVDTAAGAGSFETLLAAATAAGLVETLKGEGPFTVFAPTDEAFAALPEGTVDNLLKPENKDTLASILTYHVVPGEFMASDLKDDMVKTSVQGGQLMVDLDDGVKINGATVVSADIDASNGVIHVIDQVILPPES